MTKKEFFKKGDVNYMKKTLSLILAVLMIVATMPVAFAADPIALSASNITENPTVAYKTDADGNPMKLYVGMMADGEVISFYGGKVEYNGTVVPGHFELTNPNKVQTSAGNKRSAVTFYPDDTTAYASFKTTLRDVTYTVSKIPLVLKDSVNDPLVASEVNPMDTLSMSKLSGGEVINPLNPDDPNLEGIQWEWNPIKNDPNNTVVTESSTYQARFLVGSKYETLTLDINVNIQSTLIETLFDAPSEITLNYSALTWNDVLNSLELFAVEKETGSVVDGTFTFLNLTSLNNILYPNTYNAQLSFIPTDTEKYSGYMKNVTITVTKGIPAWTSGEALVLNYDYGATPFGQQGDRIEGIDARNLNCYDEQYNPYHYTFMLYDEKGEALTFDRDFIPDAGTYNYNVKVSIAGYASALANWDTDTLLPVTIVVAPAKAEIQDFSYSYVSGEIKGNYGNLYLNGSVDITIGDKTIEDVAVTQGRFTANWKPADTAKDADYDVTVKYTAADSDNAVVESDYTGTISYKTDRNITLKSDKIGVRVGNSSFVNENDYLITGTEVTVRAKLDDFISWTITDTAGNPIELDITSGTIADKTFTFVMPAYDIVIDADFEHELNQPETPDDGENGGGILDGIGDIDGIDGFFEWFANLFAKIKAFFEKIIAFFQGIGDMT